MAKSLPSRPHLEQLKKQAKDLLNQFHAGDSAVIDLVAQLHPDFRETTPARPRQFQLHDAQLVIAREHGFASWPKLKAEIEFRQKSFAERAEFFLICVMHNRTSRAAELLRAEPELGRANIFTAGAAGEIEYVEKVLRDDPQAAHRPGGPLNTVPLLYVCSSGFLRTDANRARNIFQIARLLLKHGADPNAVWITGPKENPWRLSALYAAAGRVNHSELTQLLLEAGANPNDNESLYHSAEFKDHACTLLLLRHGARIERSNAVHRKLDYDDIEGLRLFLDHGADPNLSNHQGDRLVHWAITNGRRVDFIQLLAERGADLRARNSQGLTPFQLASHLGQSEVTAFLASRGATEELTPQERFVAACARGDDETVRALLAQDSGLMSAMKAMDCGLLAKMAWRGNTQAVRTMLAAGFDVAATGRHGETALHNAAWMGYAEMIDMLLRAGAPTDVVESRFNTTPLGWAIHGSFHSVDGEGRPLAPGADHARIVEAILRAGAKPPAQMPESASEAVENVLLRWGVKPAE